MGVFSSQTLIGLDGRGKFYWDGNPVQFHKRLQLSTLQVVWALVIGLAAVIGGVGSGINDGFEFGCKRGWWKNGCSIEHASPVSDRLEADLPVV